MMRRLAIVAAFVLAACSGPGKRAADPPEPNGDEAVSDELAPPAQPVTVERVVISLTRNSGTDTTTVDPDGTITVAYDTLWNGRGPKSDATIRLAGDGTIASLESKGHHMVRTPEDERFILENGRATWKSLEEEGAADVTEPSFYIPMSDIPDLAGLLVAAAEKNGGSIATLPGGRVHVKREREATVTGPDGDRTIVCYTVSGLDVSPFQTWMNPDGTWWGSVSAWWSVIPKGYESSIDALVAIQDEIDRDADAALAEQLAHAPPAEGLAYTHARVLDVEKGKWLADQTVIVVGDRITWVGAAKKAKIPKGAEVVDLAGKALLPGLVDMHAHLGGPDGALNIASGVTTVRDVGNDPDKLDDLKERFDSGAAVGPHVYRFGFIEGRGEKAASSVVTAETEEEAIAGVKYYVDRGYDGIKIYNSMKVELVPVITKAAHDAGLEVTGHIPVHMLANEAVRAGFDGIEHINMLFLNFLATHETDTRDTTRFTLIAEHGADLDLKSKEVKAFFEQLEDAKTVVDPTLAVFESLWNGKVGEVPPGTEALVARLPLSAQRESKINGLPGMDVEQSRRAWKQVLAMVKALHDAKITLVAGTDSLPGVMLHRELELFVQAGIPAKAVLRIATIGAARVLGKDKDFGSIAKGKRADLVVVDGDPLKDITQIGRVVTTMRGGVVYPSAELYRAYNIQPL